MSSFFLNSNKKYHSVFEAKNECYYLHIFCTFTYDMQIRKKNNSAWHQHFCLFRQQLQFHSEHEYVFVPSFNTWTSTHVMPLNKPQAALLSQCKNLLPFTYYDETINSLPINYYCVFLIFLLNTQLLLLHSSLYSFAIEWLRLLGSPLIFCLSWSELYILTIKSMTLWGQ